MTLNLLLDSSLAKLQRNYSNQASHDFTIYFNPPIALDSGKNYKAALNKLITMSYSWYNIAEAYENNKLRWRKKSSEGWKTLIFPDGMYDYNDINTFLQAQTGLVDPDDEESGNIFSVYFNLTIFRVIITIHKDYELDLSQGNFADLLGFEKAVYEGPGSVVGGRLPDITRSVDWIFLHCDLITRQVPDVESSVLFCFSTEGLRVSYPFSQTNLSI